MKQEKNTLSLTTKNTKNTQVKRKVNLEEENYRVELWTEQEVKDLVSDLGVYKERWNYE
jgi:chromosome segregation and condensation protein ScpB